MVHIQQTTNTNAFGHVEHYLTAVKCSAFGCRIELAILLHQLTYISRQIYLQFKLLSLTINQNTDQPSFHMSHTWQLLTELTMIHLRSFNI